MNKGLTFTIIFKAQSLNYGERTGNVSELKKFSRDEGLVYSYASRQSLRYDIVRLGNRYFNWQLAPVYSTEGTKQFRPDASIKDYPEIDFFGYMKTRGVGARAQTRAAVVRISPAIALEPFLSDIEFLSNKGLADRISENPDIAQIEQHFCFYTYTVTIDLDKIGIDKEKNIKIENPERAKRVKELLEIIKILNRDVKARSENLNPLFVIGGVYEVKNPFFMGRIKLEWKVNQPAIAIEPLIDTLNIKFKNNEISKDTYLGLVAGIWRNEDKLKELEVKKVGSVEEVFLEFGKEVDNYYASIEAQVISRPCEL